MRTRLRFRPLGLDLFQDFLPLQHGREDVAGVGVLSVGRRDQTPEKLFRIFLRQGLRRRGRGGFEARTPEGKRLQVFVPLLPRFLAQILPAKAIALAKEEGVKVLPFREGAAGHRTGVRAVLDGPIVGQRIHDARRLRQSVAGLKLGASRLVARRRSR